MTNKQKLKQCYNCNGYNYKCQFYLPKSPIEIKRCVIYDIIDEDCKKIRNGDLEKITFPLLKEVIESRIEK